MKVFWAGRGGIPAPAGCAFQTFPLFSSSPTLRIDSLPPPPPPFKPLSKTFSPGKEAWIRGVEKALIAIQQKKLDKVVLARCLTLELDRVPDPFAIAAALQKKAQNAYLFCLETPERAFLGASPERLFSRTGNEIASEAVAGTRKRGATPSEDLELKNQLLSSPKELLEFFFVQNYIKETLEPLAQSPVAFSPLGIHTTPNVQHLYSSCQAKLKPGVSDSLLLDRIHPTPALCGAPKAEALRLLREIEPFDRGLYGGVIGWQTPDASEYAVAIRSCLIEGKTVRLYSGTGIVEGSDPDEEWEELDQKLKLYEGIFL